jgi:hypothetical protein
MHQITVHYRTLATSWATPAQRSHNQPASMCGHRKSTDFPIATNCHEASRSFAAGFPATLEVSTLTNQVYDKALSPLITFQ